MKTADRTVRYPSIEEKEDSRSLIRQRDQCDKYDYLSAVCCGVIGGMIDIFFVGTPGKSALGGWADGEVDHAVKRFARAAGWIPREGKKESVASAIGFLEKKFKVNYDQRYSADVRGLFDMSTRNHHIKSLSHAPDVVGLFFSVLNQFTSTSSFVSGGQVITIATDTFELQGSNFAARLFCGAANWIGHIMSDIAGSSGSAGNNGRGTGVVIPFYEMLQFCRFGKLNVGKDRQDLATIAVRAFQEGYDFRFGLSMSIPVLLTELLIRFIWSLRRYFQYGKGMKECIPTQKHGDLRVMLLLGDGTLCLMDGMDAGLRSGGNFLAFFMRLNIIGWCRFVSLVLKEVCIRLGISGSLQEELAAYQRMNEGMQAYLAELKKIDLEQYRRETAECAREMRSLLCAGSEQELNNILLDSYDHLGLTRPWTGDFDEFMGNPENRLIFR